MQYSKKQEKIMLIHLVAGVYYFVKFSAIDSKFYCFSAERYKYKQPDIDMILRISTQ